MIVLISLEFLVEAAAPGYPGQKGEKGENGLDGTPGPSVSDFQPIPTS